MTKLPWHRYYLALPLLPTQPFLLPHRSPPLPPSPREEPFLRPYPLKNTHLALQM